MGICSSSSSSVSPVISVVPADGESSKPQHTTEYNKTHPSNDVIHIQPLSSPISTTGIVPNSATSPILTANYFSDTPPLASDHHSLVHTSSDQTYNSHDLLAIPSTHTHTVAHHHTSHKSHEHHEHHEPIISSPANRQLSIHRTERKPSVQRVENDEDETDVPKVKRIHSHRSHSRSHSHAVDEDHLTLPGSHMGSRNPSLKQLFTQGSFSSLAIPNTHTGKNDSPFASFRTYTHAVLDEEDKNFLKQNPYLWAKPETFELVADEVWKHYTHNAKFISKRQVRNY